MDCTIYVAENGADQLRLCFRICNKNNRFLHDAAQHENEPYNILRFYRVTGKRYRFVPLEHVCKFQNLSDYNKNVILYLLTQMHTCTSLIS